MDAHPQDRDIAALLNGRSGDPDIVARVVDAVRQSRAIDVAQAEAKAYVARAQAALAVFPNNAYRRALADLGEYFVSRNL